MVMRAIVLIICLLVAPAQASADEWFSWNDTNTKLHVPAMLLLLADYRQTKYNSKKYYQYGGCVEYTHGRDCHYETNGLLGKTPKPHKVDQHFGYSAIVLTGVVWVLPPLPSYSFQGSVISIEARVVFDNHYLGAKISF
jgi:hypothetical protein